MTDIQRADPGARRQAVVLVLGVAAAGLLVVWLLQSSLPALEAWLAEEPADAARRVRLLAVVTGGIFAIPTLIFATWFWKQGELIVSADRFPTPGMRVVRDTPIVRGVQARARGRALQMLAVSFVVLNILFVAVLWYVAGIVATPSA